MEAGNVSARQKIRRCVVWQERTMKREELEALLKALDDALLEAFPGPEPISVLVVGGACLLFAGATTRPTKDIDVIVTDLFGMGEASLVYNLTKTTRKIRQIIGQIGKSYGLRGNDKMFLNDDCAPFLLELGDLPPMHLLQAYRKLHLYIPDDLSYILACKFIAGRAAKDYADIVILRTLLNVSTREQAQLVVDRYFPDPVLQSVYQLSETFDHLFGKKG
jgi:hypothetical protein